MKVSEKLSQGAPLAAIILVLSGIGLFLAYQLLSILQVLALAMLLALVFRTALLGLERLRAPPWLAVIILLAGIEAFAGFVWLVIVPNVSRELQVLTSAEGAGSLFLAAKDTRSRSFRLFSKQSL